MQSSVLRLQTADYGYSGEYLEVISAYMNLHFAVHLC